MVRRAAHRLVAAAATLMLGGLTGFASTPAEEQPPTYTNPVMSGVADAFSDVSLVRAKDGFWYAYATNTMLTKENQQEGGSNYLLPIVRTPDLVHWEFVGETFSEDNHPEWAGFPAGGYWAPEVRYVDGRYLMYYSVPNANDSGAAIGVATAAHPGGPWRDAGEPVVDFFTDDVVMEIDPALFIDDDGVKYLYFGSFRTQGIQVVRLSEDGTQAVGEPTQVVAGSRGEAPWVVKRDGYFYLFYSGFGCCNSGGYPVFVGRATSPTGPFLDADGIALTAEHPGGTIVNAPNGNNLIATGHNAVVTDRAGQDWNLTNAKERDDPEWGGRPPAMDRLDWIDGWPTVRAGAWSSDTPQRGPQGSWDEGSTFNDGSTHGWTSVGPGRWHLPADPDSGRHLAARTAAPRDLFMLIDETGPADYRAEADLRIDGNRAVGPRAGRAGLVIGYQDEDNHVIAWLDPAEHALVVQATVEGAIAVRASAELHTGFSFTTWSAVSAQVRGGHAAVEVSHAMDNNPLARLEIDLPVELAGGAHVGVVSHGGGQADNVGVTALYEPVTERVPEPEVGALLPEYGDDFEGQDLDAAWRTEHGDVDAELIDESLVWDTQAGNLQTGNPAGVLLRDAPVGTYTVETRVTLPFGSGAHQHPRAGLIAWTSAMDSLHLALTSTGSVRQAFLWPGDAPGPRAGDPEAIHMGPSAETMWLRMRHSIDPVTGEHRYQGATSLDGQTWRWGAVWFLPASQTPPRIGLVSMGGSRLHRHVRLRASLRKSGTRRSESRRRRTVMTTPHLSRRAVLLSAAGAGVVSALVPEQTERGARPPNVLLALADDWGVPELSGGSAAVATPTFDRIAAEGAVFTRAFADAPSCTPSRGALLTGQAPHRLGEGANLHGFLPVELATYPDLLEQAGYRVGRTRKGWGPGGEEDRSRNPAGPSFGSFEQFLDGQPEDTPFCFWFGSRDPHRPWDPELGPGSGINPDDVEVPPYLVDTPECRQDIVNYLAHVRRFDDEVGDLLNVLENQGLAQDTIVVMTSDHGWAFPRSKATCYESGTRVPLAIRWPGQVRPGTVVPELTLLSDLAPTIVAAAGRAVPGEMTGQSVLPAMSGTPMPRPFVVVERERHAMCREPNLAYPIRALRTEEWLYIRNFFSERWPAGDPTFADGWRSFGDIDGSPTKNQIVANADDPDFAEVFQLAAGKRPAEELYYLPADPHSMHNVIDEHPRVRRDLRIQLREWMRRSDDPRAHRPRDTFWDTSYYTGPLPPSR